ncbi:hypothetical protein CO710_09635 [Acetobacter orleanensis]|nr:hypothetical protein CO710_09635 [Acetobacter orleanensis]
MPCPCCGVTVISVLGEYEICPICNWEDDPLQASDPDYVGGANPISLNQANQKWMDKK